MSVAVSSWVWEHSQARGNARLVLLAIADCADDTGANAYPSLNTIADKAKVSRRTAIRAIEELVGMGELERHHGAGRRGQGGVSNGYRVTMVAVGTSDTVTPLEPEKGCQDGTSDTLALVPSEREVVSTTTRSGVTGGTRTVLNRPNTETRRKPATPVPDDFTVTDRMREWAAAEGIQPWAIDAETEQFIDWHRAKDSRNRDWTATWRTWMRKAKGWRPEIMRRQSDGMDLGPNMDVC